MYDPLIVDTFISIHTAAVQPEHAVSAAESALAALTSGSTVASAVPLTRAGAQVTTTASLDEIAASTEETLVLYDLAIGLAGHVDLGDVGDVIAKHLRRIVPASVIVFYVYDAQTDDLVSMHAAGTHSSHLVGLRIPRGERLSGWVAANKQTIVNSDPVLDLGEVARMLRPRLRSCISTPLVSGQDLIGVLNVILRRHRRL